jgi:quercetin dioxygenase-like cupin family protein/uncharacterized protein YndB with AHSA1/START domain
MATPGEVVEVGELGLRFEFRTTAAETGGAYCEFDVVGRARGFLNNAHVHAQQSERIEVIEGVLRVKLGGHTRVLVAGEAIEIPAGAAHTQEPGGAGEGRLRIRVTPARRIEAFVARLGELSRAGQINRFGYPRPLAAAAFIRDFADEGHGAQPPVAVQKAFSRALLGASERLWGEYVFADEWDVAAPPEAVFDVLADGRTYPAWWKPVYIDVESAAGPPAVGKVAHQHFKGRLPYHLRTRTRTLRLERPRVIEGETDGDLRGHGLWTLTPTSAGTHIRFDWRVYADRRLLRALTPVLRPALRWNHAWAIARARDGLEPYIKGLSL